MVNRSLRDDEKVMAFLDDIYFCSEPSNRGSIAAPCRDLHTWRPDQSVECVWGPACDVLEQIARTVNPTARVWRGSGVSTEQQEMKILGTPLGHPDFVRRHLAELVSEQRLLLERIPHVKDVQGAWLLLAHCVAEYAGLHDAGLWECLSRILQVDSPRVARTHDVATLPLALGGLGLRSAEQIACP